MILGNIHDIYSMIEINPIIKEAIEQALSSNPLALEPGSYPIENDDIFMNVISTKTCESNEKYFELHQQYIDIQILLKGKERIEFGLLNTAINPDIYHEDDDYQLCADVENQQTIELSQNMFALFIPEEPHKPGVHPTSGSSEIKKIVIKLKYSHLKKFA